MNNTLIAWQNYVDTGIPSAGSSETTLPPSNLQQDVGSASVAWQTAASVVTSGAGAVLTITPAAPQSAVRVVGLFRTNLTPGASVVPTLVSGGSTVWTGDAQAPASGYGQCVWVLDADTLADSVVFTIDDPTNPDGFINIALAFVGPAWFPASGASWDSTFGRDDQVDEIVSRGGQEYPVLRWQRRRFDLALDGIRASETWADADQLDLVSRAGGNVLFIADQTSATILQEAVFGRLQATADVSYPYQGADRRAWRAQITERI